MTWLARHIQSRVAADRDRCTAQLLLRRQRLCPRGSRRETRSSIARAAAPILEWPDRIRAARLLLRPVRPAPCRADNDLDIAGWEDCESRLRPGLRRSAAWLAPLDSGLWLHGLRPVALALPRPAAGDRETPWRRSRRWSNSRHSVVDVTAPPQFPDRLRRLAPGCRSGQRCRVLRPMRSAPRRSGRARCGPRLH